MSEVKRYNPMKQLKSFEEWEKLSDETTDLYDKYSADVVLGDWEIERNQMKSDYEANEAECKSLEEEKQDYEDRIESLIMDLGSLEDMNEEKQNEIDHLQEINKTLLDASEKLMELMKRTQSINYPKSNEWIEAMFDFKSAIEQAKEAMK